jgi:STAS domain-containing protein
VRELLEGRDTGLVVCDVSALMDPDAATIDALARLQLTARRLGQQLRLRHASSELKDLLALVGLVEALPLCAELGPGRPFGQTEERKQSRGVEERVEPDDPAA